MKAPAIAAMTEPMMDALSATTSSIRWDPELLALLQTVHQVYGYDFSGYAPASLMRRIHYAVQREQLSGSEALRLLVQKDALAMERLLLDFSINTTAMFRDSGFWLCLRQQVVPLLRTFPTVRIWSVGCSTGEEVWSLAILLREEGLSKQARIYATDFNEAVLQQAKSGIFKAEQMRNNTQNYLASGGREEFASYYTAAHGRVRFDASLLENACFAQHNLVSDGVFNEFQLIICRNVLIYFGQALQQRVYQLLHASLSRLGVLGLGNKESLRFSPNNQDYEAIDARFKVWRKTT